MKAVPPAADPHGVSARAAGDDDAEDSSADLPSLDRTPLPAGSAAVGVTP